MTYKDALTVAMTRLAADEKTIFVGQSILYGGQAMFPTFAGVPMEKRFELPVIEEFQMGFCTGLALEGYLPICVFSRFDFLLLAVNQLVNHLDKIPMLSAFRPRVILRTAVGSKYPLDAGPQHTQDHSDAFRLLLKTIPVIELKNSKEIAFWYDRAAQDPQSLLLVEYMELYEHEC